MKKVYIDISGRINIFNLGFSLCISLLMPLFLLAGTSAFADDSAEHCIGCHESLSKGSHVHQAMSMGCLSCHSAIDATKMPHKKKNFSPRGLSGKQADLCFGCHDKAQFEKKTVHAAIMLGCSSCHDPHRSKNEKLLVSSMAQLCFSCHDRDSIVGSRSVHPKVSADSCISCHNPHASDTPRLLVSEEALRFVTKQ